MHLVEQHIFEMAQEGAKLTNEERLHLEDCEHCSRLFQTFVRDQYKQRGHERFRVVYLAAR